MLAKEKVFHDPSEPLAIVGGTEVKNDDYPWMVSLQTGDEHFCGGSLIAADAVLTAAHCVVGESPEAITAVVNRNDLNSNSGEELSASQIFVHSDYDDFSLDSDIAVVLLSESSLVQPASIVRAEQLNLTAPGAEAVAIGWGSTSEFGGIISNLREVGLPIVSNEVANQPESYDGTVTDRMIAAGFAEGGKDTCGGDSGGPLFVQNQGEIYVAGITSWGDGCAQPNLYGISTRVSDFTDWIDSQVLVTSAGNVNFSQERYGELGIATVSLTDADLSGQGTAIVELRSDRGDVESLELIEAGTGRFLGSIGLSNSEVAAQNGALEVEGASNIQVVYQDANDGNGVAVESSDAARIVMDDFANGVDGAHELDLPGLVSGEIELSGDVDWFQFTAVEGQAYEITVDLNGSLSDSTLAVYDSDGETLLAFNDDTEFGLDSRIIVFGAESGTKYVEVAGFGSTVGTYSVDIKTIELGPDDHGNNAQNATAVSIGSITRGAIGFNSDVDWFSVNVVEGEKYVFDVSLDGLNDSVLRLIDSDGVTELAFNDDTNFSTASQITWTATEDEVVYVEVSAFSSGNGRYNLEILQINDDHGDDAASATVVESPSATAGRIEFGDDVDWFAIDVVEGQLYEFEVLLDGLEDSFLRLLNSDGEILAFNDDHAGELSSQINWLSTASETLFVEVSAFSGFGDYDFVVSTLEIPDDDHGNDATTATPIGANTSTSGNIEFNADVDWFSIEVIAGQVYEIDVALQSLNDSFMRLFDSDGETLFASNDDTEFDLGSRIVWFADSSRTLYVEVSSYLASGNGEYQLEVLSEEFLDDDHGNFGSNATPIELPSTTVGTIDNAIDVDWFSFNATEGQEIQFDVVLNQLPDSILRLIDSDGITQLEFNDDSEGFASQIVWLAPRTDQFFLEVFGFADATGSYQLETEVIRINQDDHGNDAENATLIEAGSITNGNIDFDFDVDWFALNIVEGKYYEIEVFLDSQPDSIVSLFDADGQTLLAVNDDGGINLGSLIVWDASMSGEVFIEVAPFSFETGSYRLGVTEIEPPEDDHGNDAAGATTVSTSTTSGIVNYATDADWFAIELIEGVEYEFTVELNGLFDSVLALYAADGETLIEINDDASEDSLASYLAWQATATEVVYLEVRGFAADTGAYSLVVSQSDDHGDDSSVATVVSLFSPISGVLEADSDIDWFAFNATGGTAYQITTDIAPAPVTLYSMDGTTEIDSQETAAFDGILWLAPEDGTYFVSVGSPGLPDAQDYELSISIPYGDANLDGRFNSADLTLVWQSGEYRDAAEDNSEWHEGDWNGDGEFGTRDIVEAMILATYELDGARNAADRQQRRLSPKDDSIEIDDQELNRVAVAVLFDRLSEDQFQFAS